MEATNTKLIIESTGGANLGRCYNSMSYRVTSDKPLSMGNLIALRELGFLGYGQEFTAKLLVEDGDPVTVPDLKFEVTGDQTKDYWAKYNAEQALRDTPPTFKLKNQHEYEVGRWVYECESRVDSSD